MYYHVCFPILSCHIYYVCKEATSDLIFSLMWEIPMRNFRRQNFHGFRGFASDCKNFNRKHFTHNANHTLFEFLRSLLRV